MHALGCFGSTLAFDRKAEACQSCDGMVACEAKVAARHPAMQALLSRFSDVSGDPMSIHWMTPEEKRERKRQMAIAAFVEAATRTVGDAQRAVAVRDSLDQKTTEFFDQMIFDHLMRLLEIPRRALQWVKRWALPTNLLPEQIHPFTGAPLSVAPLTWSHATYVETVLMFVEKEKTLAKDPTSR